jgi:hypothetical protein
MFFFPTYKLEDLKSGMFKVCGVLTHIQFFIFDMWNRQEYHVLEAQWSYIEEESHPILYTTLTFITKVPKHHSYGENLQ